MESEVLYLYGITAEGQRLPEVASTSLFAISDSKLSAIVERVSAEEFSPEVLEVKLQSVAWIAVVARKHQDVLQSAMRSGAVIPAQLCTLFSHADAVRQSLAANAEQFLDTLGRLDGRQEWGVKIFVDETKVCVTNAKLQALEASAQTASPGYAFVLTKQCDALRAALCSARIDEIVDDIVGLLDNLPLEVRFKAILPAAATGRSETMILNAAVLVSDEGHKSLMSELDQLAATLQSDGVEFELSGPWPPYSFCGEEDDEDEDSTDPVEV